MDTLLDELSFAPDTDHLILTGDLIAKGPSSTEVIDLARSLGASCVRGNHEDRVLLAHRDLLSSHVPISREHRDPDRSMDSSDDHLYDVYNTKEHQLARLLTPSQADYLLSCPVILSVGQLPGLAELVVVHGGLVPGIELRRQDPIHVMTMRTIDIDTRVPSENRTGIPWTKVSR